MIFVDTSAWFASVVPSDSNYQAAKTKFYSSANHPLARKIARCLKVLEQTHRSHPNIKPLKQNLAGCFPVSCYRSDSTFILPAICQLYPRRFD